MGESAVQLQERYNDMAGDMVHIASVTEQSMSSVEEMCASMETQNGKITTMVEGYANLDQLLSELKELADKR